MTAFVVACTLSIIIINSGLQVPQDLSQEEKEKEGARLQFFSQRNHIDYNDIDGHGFFYFIEFIEKETYVMYIFYFLSVENSKHSY